MCGIAGIISLENSDLSEVLDMLSPLHLRGPDGLGIFLWGNEQEQRFEYFSNMPEAIEKSKIYNNRIKGNVALGHTRLSIIDVSQNGAQPMCIDDGRFVISFNGEIFNYIELRKELAEEHGQVFNSKSDTEVALVAFKVWGSQCQQKFNGQWSFVIFDRERQAIFISRDRFGEKPLFYHFSEGKLCFASEIKSLFQLKHIKPQIDLRAAEDFLQHGPKEFGEGTFYNDIRRLQAGHCIEFKLSELTYEPGPERYWTLRPNLSHEVFNHRKAKELASEYYNLLHDAVRLRLRADVPIGSALSGGLDSSSIVYLMTQIMKESGDENLINTFSCVYNGSSEVAYCDESEFIDLLSNALGVNGHRITPDVLSVPKEHEKMVLAFDCPPENTCMSGWYTYKLVQKENVVVTLDGQGADEQLAGYLYYIAYFIFSLRLDEAVMQAIKILHVPGSWPYIWRGLLANFARHFIGTKLTSLVIRKIFNRNAPVNLNLALINDMDTGLATLLNNADRGSMAHRNRPPHMLAPIKSMASSSLSAHTSA